jgi:hypothetical protein
MDLSQISIYFWISLVVLVLGTIYLITQGIKVHKLFANSIVGRLINILVVVLVIELCSLGIVCFAFLSFYPKGSIVLIPIVFLLIVSLGFSIYGIRSAKMEVFKLTK